MEQPTPAHERSKCEVVLPLFEGPSGAASLGRLTGGTSAGRPVLLRGVAAREAIGFGFALRNARRFTHPAVARALATTSSHGATYVASEYIDGIAVFELLQILERAGAGLDVAVAVRVIADASFAASRIGAFFPKRTAPRCLFSDTVWIAAYGSTLISEPFVAAHAQRGGSKAESSPLAAGGPSGAVTDVATALELLLRLVLGRAHGPVLPALSDARIPGELRALLEGRQSFTKPEDVERALFGLPSRWIGSEAAVAEMVDRWVGPTLKARRERANPGHHAGYADTSDETVSFAQLLGTAHVSDLDSAETTTYRGAQALASEPLEETKNLRRKPPVDPEISVERVVLDVPFDDDRDDDQEMTTAFRPSRLMRQVRPPRRALARLAPVMALIALVVWGLSHLLVRM